MARDILLLFGGNARNALKCGSFYVNSNNDFGIRNTNYGVRLTYLQSLNQQGIVYDYMKKRVSQTLAWVRIPPKHISGKALVYSLDEGKRGKVIGSVVRAEKSHGQSGKKAIGFNKHMTIKARNLMNELVKRETLERGGDDALDALQDKNTWFAKRYVKKRTEIIDRIQNMLILGIYPSKVYKEVEIVSENKTRKICPMHFDPWNILFHAVKIVLEPIVERVLIYDSSAGRKGKGQVFGALRTQRAIRRHKRWAYYGQGDLRKYYLTIPHDVLRMILGRYIDDDLFLELIEKTMLDYTVDIEGLLEEEHERKLRYCHWADKGERKYRGCKRGVTLGNPIGQMLGNLALCLVDHAMVHIEHAKGYHRHCDDITFFSDTKEEAERLLGRLDYWCNKYGFCLKASSHVAPLCDERKGIEGRKLDFVGYVYSRDNMRVRRRTKAKAARAFRRVKSRKRRRELVGAYWGICKWGRCKHLWKTIAGNYPTSYISEIKRNKNMSFKDLGITTPKYSVDKNGKRIFAVQEYNQSLLCKEHTIINILDFEDDVEVNGKAGRCWVLYEMKDCPGTEYKFCTSSKLIREKLTTAREMGVLPVNDTFLFKVDRGGRYTYDLD